MIVDWNLKLGDSEGKICISSFAGKEATVPVQEIKRLLDPAGAQIVSELTANGAQARSLLGIDEGQLLGASAVRICIPLKDAPALLQIDWENCLVTGCGDSLTVIPAGRIILGICETHLTPETELKIPVQSFQTLLQPEAGKKLLLNVYAESDFLKGLIGNLTHYNVDEALHPIDAASDASRAHWLHYAGHMDESGLFTSEDVNSKDHLLLSLIDIRAYPSFVFANGCKATKVNAGRVLCPFESTLIYQLKSRKVRGYIGPSSELKDAYGGTFVAPFYRALVAGASLGESMSRAKVEVLPINIELACSYKLYGEPMLHPVMFKEQVPASTQNCHQTCFYCSNQYTFLGIARDRNLGNLTYHCCDNCHALSAEKRMQLLLGKSGFSRFCSVLSNACGGGVLQDRPSQHGAIASFTLTEPRKPKRGLLRFRVPTHNERNSLELPIVVYAFDPFEAADFPSQLMLSVELHRGLTRNQLPPLFVLLGELEYWKTVLDYILQLKCSAVVLPITRLYEPVSGSRIPWFRNIPQIPTAEELQRVTEKLEVATQTADTLTVESIANRLEMQPSLVAECLKLIDPILSNSTISAAG